jgi:hypothetical protein
LTKWYVEVFFFVCFHILQRNRVETFLLLPLTRSFLFVHFLLSLFNRKNKITQSPSRGEKIGGTRIKVTGGNFGPVASSTGGGHPLVVRVGDQAAIDVIHLSHTSFSFVTPEGVGENDVTVEVGNQTSMTSSITSFVYIPAQITTFSPATGPATGGWILEIRGFGFGLNASELAAANLSSSEALVRMFVVVVVVIFFFILSDTKKKK